jgi:hypothetical protein
MKSIEITGKRNIDKIHQIKEPERKNTMKWKLDDTYYTYEQQIRIINMLYLEENTNSEPGVLTKREISNKITGYKNQDKQNNILDLNYIISLVDVIEKLMACKLKCFYCRENCELLYKNTFSKKQWTLDRIDNNYGHNHDNVVICCLECNVKRGDMDSERFKRGKEIKIVRKLF